MEMSLFRKTVLVAGGAGFIGSHLCAELLGRGARVICVDSFLTGRRGNIARFLDDPAFRLIENDVAQPLHVDGRLHQIYNLASPASPPQYQADPEHTMLTNVLGTRNLLALARDKSARFVQASTSEVYGDPQMHPQKEDYVGHVNCTGTRACYDEGKRAAESLCFDHLRAGAADVRVARIFNTYGPQMCPDDGRIVSNLICQALQNRPMTIYGDGSQTRSFCYVSDMVEGLIRLMERAAPPETPVNLGNPGEFTVMELANLIRRLVPTTAKPVFRPLPQDDPRKRRPDISLAGQLLEWRPQVALEHGLRQTIPWFESQLFPAAPEGAAQSLPAAE
ncbi:NAD-dependent epimerase/dehydratase family protein [Rhodobacteraceae bacterium 2CG4]|uniref:NAD-dependent epimerase/dehydratase family protein n=1 Tax=Halovulum marinum TaxID=2662447 RepID=A0A6L5YZQ5_9RHOB|nr:UDP-glucuronic acid decarboxylase family protein [Halovulum marinum]MSU89214.1 NAD-dependent epimerase/dehydratase family protein [Halovulum marinum]